LPVPGPRLCPPNIGDRWRDLHLRRNADSFEDSSVGISVVLGAYSPAATARQFQHEWLPRASPSRLSHQCAPVHGIEGDDKILRGRVWCRTRQNDDRLREEMFGIWAYIARGYLPPSRCTAHSSIGRSVIQHSRAGRLKRLVCEHTQDLVTVIAAAAAILSHIHDQSLCLGDGCKVIPHCLCPVIVLKLVHREISDIPRQYLEPRGISVWPGAF
jgi:hypothetical protein